MTKQEKKELEDLKHQVEVLKQRLEENDSFIQELLGNNTESNITLLDGMDRRDLPNDSRIEYNLSNKEYVTVRLQQKQLELRFAFSFKDFAIIPILGGCKIILLDN